jgi:predicted ribosomally synthesized peptide with nif11-like leader
MECSKCFAGDSQVAVPGGVKYIKDLKVGDKEENMPIDKTKITKEMLDKASKCETADELVALAKAEGFTLTKEEAEAYLAELEDMELDDAALDNVAGGRNQLGAFTY